MAGELGTHQDLADAGVKSFVDQHGSRGDRKPSSYTARCGVNKSYRLQSEHRGQVTIPAKEVGRQDKEQRIYRFRRAPSREQTITSRPSNCQLQSRRVIPDLASAMHSTGSTPTSRLLIPHR